MFRTLLLVSLFFVAAPVAWAQNAGLSLTPPVIEEAADPGGIVSTQVTIANLSDNTETYYLFTRDIQGVADNGRPLFVTDTFAPSELDLSSWVSLTRTQVTLQPGERQPVQLLITVPENAPPGGHFAGIFASLEAPQARVEGAGAGVGYRVGNIVNIRVSGDIVEEAQIRSFQSDSFVYGSKDVILTARVENLGNVLVRPSGPVTITNMLGDTVAELTLNDARAGVFPQSIRNLTGEWQENGLGFGRYVAEVALVYGIPGEAQYTITGNTSFWVLPWEILRPLLITLAVLALVSYFGVRHYIKQQVRKMSGGRRLVRTAGQSAGPSPLVLAGVVMLFVTAFTIFLVLLIFA